VARVVAIQNGARPHHVRPRFRTRSDRGAVREMHDAGIDAESFQAFDRDEEPLFLLAGLAPGNRIQKYAGRSEMSEDTAQFQVLTFRKLRGETFGVIECDPEALHAGVPFQMKNCRLLFWVASRS